jgi:hypothetical protein
MCYLAREHPSTIGDSTINHPARLPRLRPRWAAAAAAAVAGVAFAAFVVAPAAKSPPPDRANAGAPAPVVSAVSTAPGAERNSTLPPDDGVPASSDVAAAPVHDCHHGL